MATSSGVSRRYASPGAGFHHTGSAVSQASRRSGGLCTLLLAERTRDMRALGINHVQIRLRSRSVEELRDQMTAWHEEVAPLLNA